MRQRIRSESATVYAPFETAVGYGHVGLGPAIESKDTTSVHPKAYK